MINPAKLRDALAAMPVMAILRGLTREAAPDVGRGLYSAGIRFMEVPLNGTDALGAMAALRASVSDDVLKPFIP